MRKVLLATTNMGKAQEFMRILSPLGVELVISDKRLKVDEGDCSFLENAYIKAKAYYDAYGIPTLADDSGLVIPTLEGFPGVFSSRFYAHPFGGLEEIRGPEDRANINKVLRLMKDKEDRRAYFVCYVVLYTGDGGCFAEGRVYGQVLHEPRGEAGFGYDPIFMPEGFDRSMAELSPEEKDAVSHRGRALLRLSEVVGWT